jgi:hypothetical protein
VDLANASGCHWGTNQTKDFWLWAKHLNGEWRKWLLKTDLTSIPDQINKQESSHPETPGHNFKLPHPNANVWWAVHHLRTGPSQIINKGAPVELNCPDHHLRTRYPPFESLEPEDHLVQSMSPCWTNWKSVTPKSLHFSPRRLSTEREPPSVTRAFGAAS